MGIYEWDGWRAADVTAGLNFFNKKKRDHNPALKSWF